MQVLLSGGMVYIGGQFRRLDILISEGVIAEIAPAISVSENFNGRIIECGRFFIAPGFADLHVHLREPGFTHKGTVRSETAAALAGGYTAVCAMPNLSPPPDSLAGLQPQLDAIGRDAAVRVLPYGCITRGSRGQELSDMAAIAPHVCGFSDDGRGVQDDRMMEAAMREAARLKKPIMAHCEVESLLTGGPVHDGRYARAHGLPGIPSESEWRMIERDIALVRKTGCRYHVCHVSCRESVALIRAAIKEGLPVSCETAPHYLCLCEDDLLDEGRFKMNPPLRAREDRDALIEGFIDGTVGYLATDHAPHTDAEKSGGLLNSPFGIVGLETAFAAVHSALVQTGRLPLETLIERISISPRRLLGLPVEPKCGDIAELTVFDPLREWTVVSGAFRSAAHATPFDGMRLCGRIEYTIYGRKLWENTPKN